MSTVPQRLASEIGREFPTTEPEDAKVARKVARYLLGVDANPPAGPYDEVIVDGVKRLLRRHGYAPSKKGPWLSRVGDSR